jgi:hypothetical protein
MKKIGCVILGLFISYVLYIPIIFLIISPNQESLGLSSESFMYITFMITLPICLIVGSMVSGYLVQPLLIKRTIFTYLLLSPGLYVAIFNLLPLIINVDGLYSSYILLLTFISVAVYLFVSVIGTRLGVFIKDKKSNQSINADGNNIGGLTD